MMQTRLGRPGSRLAFPMLAAGFLFMKACDPTPIKTLLDDPSRYDGKRVQVVGEVKESAGALGYGGYQLSDGTGTLTVVSQGTGTPRTGAKVGVEGTFKAAFTFGTKTIAVLMEEKRSEP
jgi:hypothetical protein